MGSPIMMLFSVPEQTRRQASYKAPAIMKSSNLAQVQPAHKQPAGYDKPHACTVDTTKLTTGCTCQCWMCTEQQPQ